MAKYRIEWQMGGEMIVNTQDDHTASGWDEDALSDFIHKALDMKARDIADDIADDAGVDLVNDGDGTAEITFARLT